MSRDRNLFAAFALREAALVDFEGALAYVQTVGATEVDALAPGLRALIAIDPQRILEQADGFQPAMRLPIRVLALQTLVERDPLATIGEVESLPIGDTRDELLMSIAKTYAAEDPDAALLWAKSLGFGSDSVLSAVVMGIADVDVGRALDVVLQQDFRPDLSGAAMLVASRISHNAPYRAQFAQTLAVDGSDSAKAVLTNLMTSWASSSPESAMSWILVNSQNVDVGLLSAVARSVADRDVEVAIRYTNSIPLDARSEWVAQIAASYGRHDPEGAMSWVRQFQGDMSYDAAIVSIARESAASDPRSAAQLLESASADGQREGALSVASAWAQRDPSAAADWATSLPDGARSPATVAVASVWSRSNFSGAADWVLTLPKDSTRDEAIIRLLTEAARSGLKNPSLVPAFSSEIARQQGLGRVITLLRRIAPETVNDFLNENVDSGIRWELGIY
jgi:hypothetical protein